MRRRAKSTDFLRQQGYERHLRRLREIRLESRRRSLSRPRGSILAGQSGRLSHLPNIYFRLISQKQAYFKQRAGHFEQRIRSENTSFLTRLSHCKSLITLSRSPAPKKGSAMSSFKRAEQGSEQTQLQVMQIPLPTEHYEVRLGVGRVNFDQPSMRFEQVRVVLFISVHGNSARSGHAPQQMRAPVDQLIRHTRRTTIKGRVVSLSQADMREPLSIFNSHWLPSQTLTLPQMSSSTLLYKAGALNGLPEFSCSLRAVLPAREVTLCYFGLRQGSRMSSRLYNQRGKEIGFVEYRCEINLRGTDTSGLPLVG